MTASKKPPVAPAATPPAVTKKSSAEVLKEALAAKKAGIGKGGQKLRPDMGKGVGGNKDAERLKGLSRKVH